MAIPNRMDLPSPGQVGGYVFRPAGRLSSISSQERFTLLLKHALDCSLGRRLGGRAPIVATTIWTTRLFGFADDGIASGKATERVWTVRDPAATTTASASSRGACKPTTTTPRVR